MIELAGVIVLGVLAFWIGWKLRIPSIMPLIIIGLLVGPFSVYLTPDGSKIIDGDQIFQKDLLFEFISIAVGLILFEGGMTLKREEVKTLAPTIRNLILVGSIVTLVIGAGSAVLLLDLNYQIALLFGALIIVSGPTVVGPILKNVKPEARLNTILKWEGILIDPVGALVAILIFEFIIAGNKDDHFTGVALLGFVYTVLSGVICGVTSAFLLRFLLTKNRIPAYLRNFMVLAIVVLTIGVANTLRPESGLLAVTISGIFLANMDVEELKSVLAFKEDVRRIAIAVIFILLSSRIKMEDISMLGWNSVILLAVIIFVIRPIVVFLSTTKSGLNFREKIFLSWVNPKGIVAAGVASVFTFEIAGNGVTHFSDDAVKDSGMLLPLTFFVILGTVIVQSLSAKTLARVLNVRRGVPNGVLFMGANEVARYLAKYMHDAGIPVLLSDTSKSNIIQAKALDLPVHQGSILVNHAFEKLDFGKYGVLMAMTSNSEINMVSCTLMKEEFGLKYVSRLVSGKESRAEVNTMPDHVLFNGKVDYLALATAIRKKPELEKITINSIPELHSALEQLEQGHIGLFVHTANNRIKPINKKIEHITPGDKLVYIKK